MAFSSSSELLTWLSQNLFLNPQQVGELGSVAAQADLHGFCKELLRRDWVTPYQVNQLLKDNAEGLIIGANRLHNRLGEGAMGQVFKAWNVRLGRMVAVKMLRADFLFSSKAMERFRRETQTAAQLDHPNIVLVRDADEHNRSPYLVMDYFEGTDLSRKVKQEGPQPITQAVEYVRQAALGLQHAFERGIVHRDIKPSNLLLTRGSDSVTVVKILDFGLAKFEREQDGQAPLTQAGRLLGTVDFIAPEQAQDAHKADIRADIYSLGCTLFYLLTGKAPFTGADQLEKLTARLNGRPPRLREQRPDAPAGLEDVVLKMMARLPIDRYQTPSEVAQALVPYCREAPQAVPVATPSRPVLPVVIATPVAPKPSAVMVARPIPTAAVMPVVVAPVGAMPATEMVASPQADNLPWDQPQPAYHFGDDAPLAAGPTAAIPEGEPTIASRPRSQPLLLIVICGAIALGIAGGLYLMMGKTVAGPAGTMTLEVDRFSEDIVNGVPKPVECDYAKRKPVIVLVKRTNFNGPVTLQFENLPDGFRAIDKGIPSIPPNKDKGELTFMVSYGTEPQDYSLKIVANAADSAPAYIELPVRVNAPKMGVPKLNPPKVDIIDDDVPAKKRVPDFE